MKGITPCLMFSDQAEEAAAFYVSIFPNSRIIRITHYGEAAAEASGMPQGSVMTVDFELDGQQFMALNGGPELSFTTAISFMANCETQREVDELWGKLTADGEEVVCGWLTDRYGVSWQITPVQMLEMLESEDVEAAERAMKAMLLMKKLDIETLQRAYDGES